MQRDLPDTNRRQAVPRSEDMPLLLAWTRLRTPSDRGGRCKERNCHREALFIWESYENIAPFLSRLSAGEPYSQIEDALWQQTVDEQLAGRYQVYSARAECRACLGRGLRHFINTRETGEVEQLLDYVTAGKGTLVQFHLLSHPTLGLLSPVPAALKITTPEALVRWMTTSIGFSFKAGVGLVEIEPPLAGPWARRKPS